MPRNMLVGRLTMHRDGFGFVIPEATSLDASLKARLAGDVFIAPHATGSSMHGDRVLVEVGTIRPQIVDVLYVSSKTGEGIEKVKETLAQHAATLPLVGQPWPLSWVKVEQALLARPEHNIDDRMYFGLCKSKKVQAEMAQGTLGGYLHDLGKMLYFRDDPVLKSIVVLKPNWITKAISLVLEDPVTRMAGGILEHADLARIWSVDEDGRSYARSLYPVFLRLMERFDLSYQIVPVIPGQYPTQSLVPQLLPHDEPQGVKRLWPPDTKAPGQAHVEMVYRFDLCQRAL